MESTVSDNRHRVRSLAIFLRRIVRESTSFSGVHDPADIAEEVTLWLNADVGRQTRRKPSKELGAYSVAIF